MNTDILATIVIPVFEAQEHLCECIESALNQSISSIEIICVDGCSTDSSPDILAYYRSLDSRIRVLQNKKNMGEGFSRNKGIEHEKGEFIFHLDSDDFLPHDALSLLLDSATANNSDMAKGGFSVHRKNGTSFHPSWNRPDTATKLVTIFDSPFLQQIPGGHWSYLYRRDFLEKNNIRYPVDTRLGLDITTLAQALIAAKRVSLIPEIVYCYRQTEYSASRGTISLSSALEAIETDAKVYDILYENDLKKSAIDYLKRSDHHVDETWPLMAKCLNDNDCRLVFDKFRNFAQDKCFPWKASTSIYARHILCLLLLGRDQEAISILRAPPPTPRGLEFGDKISRLKFVVEHSPHDIDSTKTLSRLLHDFCGYQEAQSFYSSVIKVFPDHLPAHIGLIDSIVEQGDNNKGMFALESLIRKIETAPTLELENRLVLPLYLIVSFGRIQDLRNRLTQTKSNVKQSKKINKKLLTEKADKIVELARASAIASKHIAAIEDSKSWRLTAPLRKSVDILHRQRRPRKRVSEAGKEANDHPVNFIDIPQNGGSRIRVASKVIPNLFYKGHNTDVFSLPKGAKTLVVLRDPVDRFCAAVQCLLTHHSEDGVVRILLSLGLDSPEAFISALSSNKHPHHEYASRAIRNETHKIGKRQPEFRWAYTAQIEWIMNPTYVVMFENLEKEMELLLHTMSYAIELPHANTTIEPDDHQLSDTSLDYLRRLYRHDFKLIEIYQSLPMAQRLGLSQKTRHRQL